MILMADASLAAPPVPSIANAGFEDGQNGWGWMADGRAAVRFSASTDNPHSGSKCMVFVKDSPLAAGIYGRLYQDVAVQPNTEYELSIWIKGNGVEDKGGLNHFTDWKSYTLSLPAGTYDWQKVSMPIKTGPDQSSLSVGINVVNACKELAIDDISLKPTGVEVKGEGAEAYLLAPTKVYDHGTNSYLGLYVADNKNASFAEVAIYSRKNKLFSVREQIKPGENELKWKWNTGNAAFGPLSVDVKIRGAQNRVLASAEYQITKAKSPLTERLDQVEVRLAEFNTLYAKCKAKGIPLDYPTVTKTLLDQFLPFARADVMNSYNWRADYAATDFSRSLDWAIAEMHAYLDNPKLAPDAVRYKTGKVDIKNGSFLGETVDSRGENGFGPLFFCGYGHFVQARKDMFRWPGYGINLIQLGELGPSGVLVAEDKISLEPVKTLTKALDDAAKNNVRVDVLLSPHYFPEWAMKKWPELKNGGGNFLAYCVDAPEAKQVIEKFLRTVLPMIKDKAAINSFCLSNEPTFDRTATCKNTKPMWVDYLKKTHGQIAELNKRYGTSYASFDEVPIPKNNDFAAPQFYDYCSFNNQRFVAWHKWMADIIHEYCPNVPVHAKIMSHATMDHGWVAGGVDPELFGQLLDLNGNDRGNYPSSDYWGSLWHSQNVWYDLQRSLNKKPVYNSENHLQPDGSNYYVAPEHYQHTLWQGAIHGQGATTIWVWEHPTPWTAYEPSFVGNVMDRPGCAETVGRTCLDLNRFATEVTALQNVNAPVAIVWSITSHMRDEAYMNSVIAAYESLNFCGVKVDFVSEKQLAEGRGSHYSMIVLPQCTHITEAALNALGSLPSWTKLVIYRDAPVKDTYTRDLAPDTLKPVKDRALTISGSKGGAELWTILRKELSDLGVLPEISVVDAATGEPVWGVEWLPVKAKGRTVINIVNLRTVPIDVKVISGGKQVECKDLLSIVGRESVKTLKPVTPVLAEVEE
jgi:hypothetical protein